MAQTWTKGPLVPVYPQGANLEFCSLYGPEGASQTFVVGDVLTVTSGYLVLGAAAAAVSIFGVAQQAGHNTTAGTYNVQYAPVFPGMFIYANLLGTSAGDEVLAATDLGTAFELERSTTLVGGDSPGWYINGDATGTPAVKVVSFFADPTYAPVASIYANEARVGDTNARVMASIIAAQTGMTV
jgi:hypothetical protein